MSVFINIQKEIVVTDYYEKYGLKVVKGSDKAILNRIQEVYYLNLKSFASKIKLEFDLLMELINYSPGINEYLAYYRDENYKFIRVLELAGRNELVGGLRGRVPNLEALRKTREQAYKLHNQLMEKE
ncbi:hypothetical protein [Sediminibacillus albus]|uniref:Uncharacterized protein n=1 Tax=Sediminibacillus albus TaxID=407036 RepID=A0A1G8WG01_9BACI|nr:hypothetical protein [Sediminibacillus albus]SDJ77141.1 hypothetical protein SAMN05216243_0776 [Sediminibacillus albus]